MLTQNVEESHKTIKNVNKRFLEFFDINTVEEFKKSNLLEYQASHDNLTGLFKRNKKSH